MPLTKSDRVNGLAGFMKSRSRLVNAELRRLLSRRSGEPETLRKAMSYSIFAGGKRLRPVLVLAAAESCGLKSPRALGAAAAMEMIHTYSLIHDDLPAMDDDDLRRGRKTNHKVFGEAMAILAGDGLLTYAFEAAASNAAAARLDSRASSRLIQAIARGAGTQGMVGGQVEDMEAERLIDKNGNGGTRGLRARLRRIHIGKTAALITASLEAGGILAKARPKELAALRSFGRCLGLAFQIADDILDVVGDKSKLGKRGSDRENNKLTYASLYGLENARRQAKALVAAAHRALAPLGARAGVLHALADFVIERDR